MMMSSGNGKLIVLVVAMLLVAAPAIEGAQTCQTLYDAMQPCIPYLSSGGSTVPTACCSMIQAMKAGATTKLQRQGACKCLKKVAVGVSDATVNRAATIFTKCGVAMPYKISPSTDCSKLN